MDTKSIGLKLKELNISPSLLCWGDDVVCCTEIWYDENTNRMCSDCGVSVHVDEPLNIAKLMIDIEVAVHVYLNLSRVTEGPLRVLLGTV